MRFLALLATAALLAGCVQPTADPIDTSSDVIPSGGGPGPVGEEDDEPVFCESEDECDFYDDDHHEYVLYDVDSVVLDVLIVPSASADHAEDTVVLKAAVDAWAAGIQELGSPWFATNLTINAYVLGKDSPPQEAVSDPEIVVLAAEYNPVLLFGIGLEPKQLGCAVLGQETVRAYEAHAHDGMRVLASDCSGAGFVCFAVNTNFLNGSPVYLQDLVAHEFGHCLGAGHVGDALDFKAKRVPVQDIMSYQHDDEQVHCVSNLNVRLLEALYAPLLGVEVDQPVSAGDFYVMPRGEYAHVACANAV